MSEKIVILDGHTLNPGDISWEPFERLGEVTLYQRSAGQVAERSRGAPIVITNKDKLSAEIIEQLPDLKYIGVTATGTNIVDLAAATRHGVVVTNAPAYGPESVAQHTIALLLELTNNVARHAAAVRDGRWAACPDFCFTVEPITGLAGKTMGVIGIGAIGRRVAQVAAALGMQVAAHDPGLQGKVEIPNVGIAWLSLDELLEQADVVTLHCPLTEATSHLIDAARLSRMKKTAYLINAARGPLVDEPALAAALREGQIAGAALDVLSVEPPVNGNPLIDEPRCIVTPHIAWAGIEARKRLMQIAADNLRAYLEGNPVNVVNRAV
jgi:glycerate dehydrogenase